MTYMMMADVVVVRCRSSTTSWSFQTTDATRPQRRCEPTSATSHRARPRGPSTAGPRSVEMNKFINK